MLKQSPWVRTLGFQARYWMHHNRQHITGNHNQISFETHSYLPSLQQVKFEIEGDHNTIVIAAGARLSQTRFLIQGSHNRIVIGADCTINQSCLWIQDDRAHIQIGEKTTISGANIGIADPDGCITIGADCMLSHGIEIRCGDSHAVLDRSTGQRLNQAHYVTIEPHVWLGMHVRVLKDLTIGTHSVVAAGAIVTKSIEPYCLAAGIPAQVRRENITWSRDKNPESYTERTTALASS